GLSKLERVLWQQVCPGRIVHRHSRRTSFPQSSDAEHLPGGDQYRYLECCFRCMATRANDIGRRCRRRRGFRSEEHTSELQSQSNLVCRLLLEKKKKKKTYY